MSVSLSAGKSRRENGAKCTEAATGSINQLARSLCLSLGVCVCVFGAPSIKFKLELKFKLSHRHRQLDRPAPSLPLTCLSVCLSVCLRCYRLLRSVRLNWPLLCLTEITLSLSLVAFYSCVHSGKTALARQPTAGTASGCFVRRAQICGTVQMGGTDFERHIWPPPTSGNISGMTAHTGTATHSLA